MPSLDSLISIECNEPMGILLGKIARNKKFYYSVIGIVSAMLIISLIVMALHR